MHAVLYTGIWLASTVSSHGQHDLEKPGLLKPGIVGYEAVHSCERLYNTEMVVAVCYWVPGRVELRQLGLCAYQQEHDLLSRWVWCIVVIIYP